LQRGMNTIWLSKNIVIQNITEKISSKIINVNEKFLLCCTYEYYARKLCKKRDPSLVYKQAKALSVHSTLFMILIVCVNISNIKLCCEISSIQSKKFQPIIEHLTFTVVHIVHYRFAIYPLPFQSRAMKNIIMGGV
jgi:hypothetical protein